MYKHDIPLFWYDKEMQRNADRIKKEGVMFSPAGMPYGVNVFTPYKVEGESEDYSRGYYDGYNEALQKMFFQLQTMTITYNNFTPTSINLKNEESDGTADGTDAGN
jgi:hypothetical protein